MEKDYSKSQLEDKALKSAALYFGEELLPYLQIGQKIRRLLPTEQIRLEAVRATEDILFEMEDDTLAHFEFESREITPDDLRRFRAYDAYTGMVYKKSVTTYCICSGKLERICDRLEEGQNPYRIIPIQMKQMDADTLFTRLKEMTLKGLPLTKKELAPLLLTPLMAGESSICDRILTARELLNAEQSGITKEEFAHMEAVLYSFACKFLEQSELEEVEEVFGMTVLGEMIWNSGLEKGIEKGHGMTLITLVMKKLQKGKSPVQIAEELEAELPFIERICTAVRQCAPCSEPEEIYRIFKTMQDD